MENKLKRWIWCDYAPHFPDHEILSSNIYNIFKVVITINVIKQTKSEIYNCSKKNPYHTVINDLNSHKPTKNKKKEIKAICIISYTR
jgi:hypothetical protein